MMNDSILSQSLPSLLERVPEAHPLVHCITNFVTVNDCANIILAAGGSPTMSRHPEEVAEITSGCDALVLNMGTISDVEAMLIAGRKANELGHPVILDPVGAGASAFRRNTAKQLLDSIHFAAIRGNATEIRYLSDGSGLEKGGVDADLSDRITEDNAPRWAKLASALAARLKTVVCISGATDIIADTSRAYAFPGGSPLMGRITGSGCMLTSLMGTYLGAVREAGPSEFLNALLCAQAEMNAAGEIAEARTAAAGGGTMTFRMHLIDAVSLMKKEQLQEYMKIHEVHFD